jgi:hypothetical protein
MGPLVLLVPVIDVAHLYEQPMHAHTMLLAELYNCLSFGDFGSSVMAAYEATLQQSTTVIMGTDTQHPMEKLCKIAGKGSCMVLQRVGEASIVILLLLGQ